MKRILAALAAAATLAVAASAYDTIHFLPIIKSGDVSRPAAAAASGERLYVLDARKSELFIFDREGRLLKAAGSEGAKPGQFSGPRGVAVGSDGKVYVADTGNDRVEIFDRDGNFLTAFGEKGSQPGHLRSPESAAVGADGRIYVADTGNDRVQVFTDEGILLYQVGAPGKLTGQLRSPSRVVVDASDDVYVLDRGNGRIQKFDASAKPVMAVPLEGNDFDVDAYGFLYVLDGRDGKVVEDSPDGREIGRFGSYGTGIGQMKKAQGIALEPDGTLIVLDTRNARIQRVELTEKLETTPLPVDAAAKMLLTGPTRDWPATATALAAYGDDLYAYLPQGGPFAVFGPDGKAASRFGAAKGKGRGVTRGSGGLAVSGKLGIFASDTPDDRLQRFALDGKWQANIGESTGFFDGKKKEGRLRAPNGVAINDDGTVYVADTENRRIDAFSPDGVFVFSVGPTVGSYELQEPVAVAWDKAGFLYFADKGLKRVFKCEPSGALVASWGSEGDGPGQFEEPVSIAFDGENDVYTLDARLDRVSVYTRDGQWVTDFFAGGREEHELLGPVAVAVSGRRLVISDAAKGKLLSFDLHPKLAAPVGISTSTKEGIVSLAWQPVADPWSEGYEVFRSSRAEGPFESIANTKEEKYSDSDVASYEKYWYRVATVAKTKDVGPWSAPLETFVAGSFNRAPVEISSVTLGDMFAAKYKWYLQHPVGKVTITNNVNVPYQNVKVTFKLKDYMDFGFDTEIKRLEPKQSIDIPLIAT
ncbi:MAG TPA: NHL repeat-containing protein, partial [Elusimicrobiota bacterium]|nr:NHL repeat-containing protein [Elusimicrobiota bacterium]